MTTKYAALERRLLDLASNLDAVTLTVQEIELLLGSVLPGSAYRHPAWWSNSRSHSHALSWLDSGFEVDGFQLGSWVRFRRAMSIGKTKPPASTSPVIVEKQKGDAGAQLHAIEQPQVDQHLITQAKEVVLVSCVKTKRAVGSPASQLYTSAWFNKAKAYVQTLGLPWFILSAKYGLVHPEAWIEPYEQTLNTMSTVERKAWSAQVIRLLQTSTPELRKCVVLAGHHYREFLIPQLDRLGIGVEVPMSGLTQGRQMNWLGSKA